MAQLNRRTFIGVTAGAVLLPMLSVKANSRVVWETGALANPHAALVAEWIEKRIAEGCTYTRGGMALSDYRLELRDPRFVVRTGKQVWRALDGYCDEPGLAITLIESGIEVDTVGIWSSEGLSTPDFPAYGVRPVWINYEDSHDLRAALGDRLTYDMRWLEHFDKPESAARQGA